MLRYIQLSNFLGYISENVCSVHPLCYSFWLFILSYSARFESREADKLEEPFGSCPVGAVAELGPCEPTAGRFRNLNADHFENRRGCQKKRLSTLVSRQCRFCHVPRSL